MRDGLLSALKGPSPIERSLKRFVAWLSDPCGRCRFHPNARIQCSNPEIRVYRFGSFTLLGSPVVEFIALIALMLSCSHALMLSCSHGTMMTIHIPPYYIQHSVFSFINQFQGLSLMENKWGIPGRHDGWGLD